MSHHILGSVSELQKYKVRKCPSMLPSRKPQSNMTDVWVCILTYIHKGIQVYRYFSFYHPSHSQKHKINLRRGHILSSHQLNVLSDHGRTWITTLSTYVMYSVCILQTCLLGCFWKCHPGDSPAGLIHHLLFSF